MDILTITSQGGAHKKINTLVQPVIINLINAKLFNMDSPPYQTDSKGCFDCQVISSQQYDGDLDVSDITIINAQYNSEYNDIDGVLTIHIFNPIGPVTITIDNTWINNTNNKYRVNNQIFEIAPIDDEHCTISNTQYARTNYTTIDIKDGIISIGNHAFEFCNNLTRVAIPDGVTSIGSHTFYSCQKLRSVTIPDSVTLIGDAMFYNCQKLTNVTIPDSVTSIGNSAFTNCEKLTSIIIGNGVTSIGRSAFFGCSLADIYYTGSESDWNNITIDSGNSSLTNATIHYNYIPS